ncbi:MULTISPECIES: hypothetical protein [unclassified Ruegeria]|uniref:hypothetical protein n=1 Tax=unclassified Ruegeria TaxID=2625375 RepID=UPI001AE566D4|nr:MULTISPECIES: hypothetical protein [unclassified Ruegeria]
MIKTAIEVAPYACATMQPQDPVMNGEVSNNTNSSSSRFPPIENALSEIVNNKRLEEANRDF